MYFWLILPLPSFTKSMIVSLFGSPYMRGMEKRVWVAHGKWTEAGDDQVSITTREKERVKGNPCVQTSHHQIRSATASTHVAAAIAVSSHQIIHRSMVLLRHAWCFQKLACTFSLASFLGGLIQTTSSSETELNSRGWWLITLKNANSLAV